MINFDGISRYRFSVRKNPNYLENVEYDYKLWLYWHIQPILSMKFYHEKIFMSTNGV